MGTPMITQRITPCLVLLALMSFATTAWPDVTVTLHFSPSDLHFTERFGYDLASFSGCSWTEGVGKPMLPTMLGSLVIGPNERVTGVEVVNLETTPLSGTYHILPVQPSVPIGSPPEGCKPDQAVYGSSSLYPDEIIRCTRDGSMAGYRLASLEISPLRYSPSVGRLELCSRITVTVRTQSAASGAAIVRTPWGERLHRQAVRSSVLNPEDIDRYQPAIQIAPCQIDGGPFEYLVVTTDEMASLFAPLVEWKNQRGVRAVVRTVEWIDEHYTGVDRPERVRNYLKEAYQDSGLVWVLLGGDIQPVGHRMVVSGNDSLPCDMYFSCLDGTWNANGDEFFGEEGDDVDLYPDVYVGRAPVEYQPEVEAFVAKAITYERAEATDYQELILFLADSLDEITDAGDAKDSIQIACVPPELTILKLYARYGNLSRENALRELNAGYNLVNHDGHGNTEVMEVGDGTLTNGDFYTLTNGPRFSTLYTLGCWCGAFDREDCIGEEFAKSRAGGGYFVGNARYGLYQMGLPGVLSGEFDKEWWCKLFNEDQYHAGATLAHSKVPFIEKAQREGDYRYITFELNLFGDPETPLWTGALNSLEITAPDTLSMGASMPCTVQVRRDGSLTSGIAVCLYGQGDVFVRDTTDGSGTAILSVTSTSPGEVALTAGGRNDRPAQTTVTIRPDYPYPLYWEHEVDDSDGVSPNGRAEPGETAKLWVTLRNVGIGDATGVEATLSAPGQPSYIRLTQYSSSYPGIPQGETAVNEIPFIFSVDPECPQGYWATLIVDVIADGGFHQLDTLSLLIKSKFALLVDDDDMSGAEVKVMEVLDSLQVERPGAVYDVAWSAAEALPDLRNYRLVIWITGKEADSTLTIADRDSLAAALDAGTSLLLSGQNIGNDIGDTEFYRDHLHAVCINDSVKENKAFGVDGTMTQGFEVILMGQDCADAIGPREGGQSLFTYDRCGESAAVQYRGDRHIVITLGFDLHGIRNIAGFATAIDFVRSVFENLGVAEHTPPPHTTVFRLRDPSPNPFRQSCTISYVLPAKTHTRLSVYNILGQRVRVLVDDVQDPGSHLVHWDGHNDRDLPVASGVYFYRIEAGSDQAIRKMVMMR
jgi:hypothetical protein